jgi:predicted Zn-dependent protease
MGTIYTSEQDISDSVIAHEIGHAVVDHFFTVKPPEKIGEMLAQYVDVHLGQK